MLVLEPIATQMYVELGRVGHEPIAIQRSRAGFAINKHEFNSTSHRQVASRHLLASSFLVILDQVGHSGNADAGPKIKSHPSSPKPKNKNVMMDTSAR